MHGSRCFERALSTLLGAGTEAYSLVKLLTCEGVAIPEWDSLYAIEGNRNPPCVVLFSALADLDPVFDQLPYYAGTFDSPSEYLSTRDDYPYSWDTLSSQDVRDFHEVLHLACEEEIPRVEAAKVQKGFEEGSLNFS